ncbi:Uncharacterised protein [Mycobacteroides abscessus subsp. abscessus]|nr:Uncharacterised protein [Mycobacteroides abscessus subsp. abscessus]
MARGRTFPGIPKTPDASSTRKPAIGCVCSPWDRASTPSWAIASPASTVA